MRLLDSTPNSCKKPWPRGKQGICWGPLRVPAWPKSKMAPLSPADGLFDWPLLQMDEVVQSGGALVIIHLCNKCPIQGGAVPSSQPSAPTLLPLNVFVPCHPLLPHEPSGPGRCVQISAPSAVAECQCQTCGSTECTHGFPGHACWWDRRTTPLASWGLGGKGGLDLSLREKQDNREVTQGAIYVMPLPWLLEMSWWSLSKEKPPNTLALSLCKH